MVILSESSFWPVIGIVILGFVLFYFLFAPSSGGLVPIGSSGGFAGPSYSGASGKQAQEVKPVKPVSETGDKGEGTSGWGGLGSALSYIVAGLAILALVYFLLKGGRLGRFASGGSRLVGGVLGRIWRRPSAPHAGAAPATGASPAAVPGTPSAAPKKSSWFGRLFSRSKFRVKLSKGKLVFGGQAAIDASFAAPQGVPVPGFVVFEVLSAPAGVSLAKNGALAAGDELDPGGRIVKLVLDAQGRASALFSAGAESGNAKVRVFIPPAGPGSAMVEKKVSIKIVPPAKPKAQAAAPAAATAAPPVQPQPAVAPKKAPGFFGRLVSGSGGKLEVKLSKDKLFFGEQTGIDSRFVPSGPGIPAPGFIVFELVSAPAGVSLAKNGALAAGDEIDQANKILKLVPDSQGKVSALFSAGDGKGNAQVRVFTVPAGPGSFMHEKKVSIKIVPPAKLRPIKPIGLSAKSAAPAKSDFALVLKAEHSKIAFGEVSGVSAKPVCKDGSVDLSMIDRVYFRIFEEPGSIQAPAGVSLSSGDTSVSAGYELSAGIVRGAALVLLKAGNEAGKVELRAYCYLPSGEGVDAKSVSVKIMPKHGVSVKEHIKDLKGIYSRAKEGIPSPFGGALSIAFEPGPRVLAVNDKLELKAKIISRKKGVDASKFGNICFEVIGDTRGAYLGDERAFKHAKNKIIIPVDRNGSASVFLTSGRDKGKVVVRAFFYKDAYNLEPVHSSKLSIDIREKPQAKKPGGSKPIARPEPATSSGAAMDMSRVSLQISNYSSELSFIEKEEIAIWFTYDNEALNAPVIPEVHVDIAKTVPPGVQCWHKVKYGWHDDTGRKDFNIPLNSKGVAILKFIAGSEAGEFPFRVSCFIEPGRQLSVEGGVKILPRP